MHTTFAIEPNDSLAPGIIPEPGADRPVPDQGADRGR
jgi:hypothetical protein